jgi:hypothetical protein
LVRSAENPTRDPLAELRLETPRDTKIEIESLLGKKAPEHEERARSACTVRGGDERGEIDPRSGDYSRAFPVHQVGLYAARKVILVLKEDMIRWLERQFVERCGHGAHQSGSVKRDS